MMVWQETLWFGSNEESTLLASRPHKLLYSRIQQRSGDSIFSVVIAFKDGGQHRRFRASVCQLEFVRTLSVKTYCGGYERWHDSISVEWLLCLCLFKNRCPLVCDANLRRRLQSHARTAP